MRMPVCRLEVRYGGGQCGIRVPGSTAKIGGEKERWVLRMEMADEERVVEDAMQLVVDVARFALDSVAV